MLRTAWCKNWCGEHGSTPNGTPTNNKVAIFCLTRSHVLLASQQCVPLAVLPLGATLIHYAQTRLHRHSCSHLHLLLPTSLLLFHVPPFLMWPLIRFHYHLRLSHRDLFPPPIFPKPSYRVFRTMLFFGMGMSGVAPIIHKTALYHDQPEAIQTTGYEVLMGLLYGLGALIYATRIPERWMPG